MVGVLGERVEWEVLMDTAIEVVKRIVVGKINVMN